MSTSTAAVPDSSHIARPSITKAAVSPVEQALRAAAAASANGHNAMEGLFSSSFTHDLQNRYVSGEMGIEDAVEAAKRHYGIA